MTPAPNVTTQSDWGGADPTAGDVAVEGVAVEGVAVEVAAAAGASAGDAAAGDAEDVGPAVGLDCACATPVAVVSDRATHSVTNGGR